MYYPGLVAATFYALNDKLKERYAQKDAIVSLGVNEASYVLSRNRFLHRKRIIDPFTGYVYMYAAGNQFWYVKMSAGHDLVIYAKHMANIYGLNSDKFYAEMSSKAYLDLLDPRLYASAYSVISGRNISLPILNINNDIGIIPSLSLVLTPYAVLEKRFLLDVFTRDREIRLGLSYEKDYSKLDSVYYGEFAINKIASFNKMDIGANLAFWKQPELLLEYPAEAKNHVGGMLALDFLYHLTDSLKLSVRAAYKTGGYVLGETVYKAPIFKVSLNFI